MNKIKVVGMGPGALDYITPIAMNAIKDSDILVGGKRNIESVNFLGKKIYEFSSNMEEMVRYIQEQSIENKVCVIVSGDTGFYSMLDFLIKRLGQNQLEAIPGISSFQYLFSKLTMTWKDYSLISVHGRNVDYKVLLEDSKGVFLLTDKTNTPSKIAQELLNEKHENYRIIIGENLSYEDEKITIAKPKEIIDKQFSDLCVVVIDKDELGL